MDEKEIRKRFADYLIRRRMEEGFRQGRMVSQSEMARLVGISQGSLSQFENQSRLPDDKNRDILAAYYGVEIYDILDKPRRIPADKDLARVISVWGKLPTDARKKLASMVESEADEWTERSSPLAGKAKGVVTE